MVVRKKMKTNYTPSKKTITLIAFFIMMLSVISISIVVKADETTWDSPNKTGYIYHDFKNPEAVFTSDSSYATAEAAGSRQDYSFFGFSIDSTAEIEGIEVEVEGQSKGNADFSIELSKDFGSSWTTAKTGSYISGSTDTVVSLGGNTDLWGESSWIPTDFNNNRFCLCITHLGAPTHFGDSKGPGPIADFDSLIAIDNIRVQVSYSIPSEYTLTINTDGSGTTNPTPGQHTYTDGTTVDLQATPSAGHTFSHWTGHLTGSTNPTTITMNENKIITAHFTEIPPDEYTLTINTDGSGTTNPTPGQHTYTDGTTVDLQATPNAGHTFSHWTGHLTGSTNPTTITMNENKIITAHFVEEGVNIPPIVEETNVTPANLSSNQELSLPWSVFLKDLNGDLLNWTLECSNGQFALGENDSNYTRKELPLSGLSYNTEYSVYVIVNDGTSWTNKTFKFTTKSSGNNNNNNNNEEENYVPPLNKKPTANPGGPYTGYIRQTITLNASESTDPDGTITSYEWDLGDGNTATGMQITHAYTQAETYTITLKVTDNKGASRTATTTATITQNPGDPIPPIAKTNGPYQALINQNITLNASQSHDPDGHIVKYTWDLGDDSIAYGQTITHQYNQTGIYIITLTVTDNNSLTANTTTYATIKQDTDQDGLTDDIEELIGSNLENPDDVTSIILTDTTHYLVDLDNDGENDLFYNTITQTTTDATLNENGEYEIDLDGDKKPDITYNPETGEIKIYEQKQSSADTKGEKPLLSSTSIMLLAAVIAIIMILTVLVLHNRHPQAVTNVGPIPATTKQTDAEDYDRQLDLIIKDAQTQKTPADKPKTIQKASTNSVLFTDSKTKTSAKNTPTKTSTKPSPKKTTNSKRNIRNNDHIYNPRQNNDKYKSKISKNKDRNSHVARHRTANRK